MTNEDKVKQLARWIKIRVGGGNYTMDEITGAYRRLMTYNGYDPDNPPIGLDLVEATLLRLWKEGTEA